MYSIKLFCKKLWEKKCVKVIGLFPPSLHLKTHHQVYKHSSQL